MTTQLLIQKQARHIYMEHGQQIYLAYTLSRFRRVSRALVGF